MIHLHEGIAGWISVGGIALKVASLGIQQVVRNRPYPWEEGRLGRAGKWLDLLTNPVFGTGAFATVVSAWSKVHSPADWAVQIGHGAVGAGAWLLGGPGVVGKLREGRVAARQLDYQRDLAEYKTFFELFPEEALELSVPKKPRGLHAGVITLGAGTAVIAGGVYNIIDFYRIFSGSPPTPHAKPPPITHPTPKHPAPHPTPGHSSLPTRAPQPPTH